MRGVKESRTVALVIGLPRLGWGGNPLVQSHAFTRFVQLGLLGFIQDRLS